MKLASVVAISAIKVAMKRLGITMSASVSPIKMAIELGHFLIEKNFYEEITAERITIGDFDGFILDFFKTKTDNVAFAENAVYEFGKALTDQSTVSHTEVFDFYKYLSHTAVATDEPALSVEKPLFDSVTGLEDSTYVFTKKVKEDTVGIVETEFYEFGKALTEAPQLTDDDAILQFFKNSQDALAFTDVETIDFAKFLVDAVGVTDDVDGAASVLDDQEMQFVKNTSDVAAATDQFVRVVQFTRAFNDAPSLTDNDTLAVGKNIADAASTSDTNRYDFDKLLTDTPVATESIALDVTLAPFTDNGGVTDIADVVPNKVVSDTTSMTDAGSYRSQGYCDFTYFAEDYVGASGTF